MQYINDESEQLNCYFSRAHWKTKTINYKCSDYISESRLTAKIEINKIDNIIKLIEWEIKKPHFIKPEEHNYNYDNNIIEDMKYQGTLIIKRKCSNLIYILFKYFK